MSRKRKCGIILIIIGLVLPMISFGLTDGYDPQLGLLWSIRNMEVVLVKDTYVGEYPSGYWANRLTISYFLLLAIGFVLVGVGAGLVLFYPIASETEIKRLTLAALIYAAEQGDVSAQFNLGFMCRKGEGVSQNCKAAIKWLTLAAEQGYVRAQVALGWMYYDGEGIPQNYETAIRWYKRASEQGHAEAQYYVKQIAEDLESLPSQKSSEKSEKTKH